MDVKKLKPGTKKLAEDLSKEKPKKVNPFAKKPSAPQKAKFDAEPDLDDAGEEFPAPPGKVPMETDMPYPPSEELPMEPTPPGRDLGGPQMPMGEMSMGGGTDTPALLSRVLALAEALAAQLPRR
jgi:hypothetical protein